jgi:ATP-dependent DNA ligase
LRRAFAGIERWNFRRQPGKIAVAKRRLQMAGGALDGIVAKRLDMDYRSGERMGMQKIKRLRTADCVVGGFRYASQGHAVGSLLLGLYDDEGYLNHVGFASGFPQQGSKALLKKVEPLIRPDLPGMPPADQAAGAPTDTGNRFRHGTKFLRWRPDKSPKACSMARAKRKDRAVAPKILAAASQEHRT